MTDYRVVDATEQHLDALVKFNAALAAETEDKRLDERVLTRGVRAVLEDAGKGRYFVALDRAEDVVGCLLVTYEWSDWRDGWFWWIQSVYVAAAHRRRGVYGLLYDHVRARAAVREDVYGFRLYVEVGNDRARQTYRRLGMTECGYRMYEAALSPAQDRP